MITLSFPEGQALAAKLRALGQPMEQTVVIAALRHAAEPMRTRMEALAPRGPDAPHLADHLAIQTVTNVGGGRSGRTSEHEYAVAVGPTKDYFYGLMWEYGWVFHPQAHPFMRPSFDATVQTSLSILGEELWAAVRGDRAASSTVSGV